MAKSQNIRVRILIYLLDWVNYLIHNGLFESARIVSINCPLNGLCWMMIKISLEWYHSCSLLLHIVHIFIQLTETDNRFFHFDEIFHGLVDCFSWYLSFSLKVVVVLHGFILLIVYSCLYCWLMTVVVVLLRIEVSLIFNSIHISS